VRIGIFGPDAARVAASLSPVIEALSGRYALVPVASDGPWGKASADLVKLIYEDHVLGLIATDRNSSHLAEQLAVKSFVPLIAVTADRDLTSVNIPWVFRLPPGTPARDALRCLLEAVERAGPNRGRVRDALASGPLSGDGTKFDSRGEVIQRRQP
jgi:hypothetical protein